MEIVEGAVTSITHNPKRKIPLVSDVNVKRREIKRYDVRRIHETAFPRGPFSSTHRGSSSLRDCHHQRSRGRSSVRKGSTWKKRGPTGSQGLVQRNVSWTNEISRRSPHVLWYQAYRSIRSVLIPKLQEGVVNLRSPSRPILDILHRSTTRW